MFGPWFNQVMRYRLGVGKPLEGYGGFGSQPNQNGGVVPPIGGITTQSPTPWMHQGPGANIPQESPMFPKGVEGGPYGPPHPKPQDPTDSQPSGMGYMGGFKNPWQRY